MRGSAWLLAGAGVVVWLAAVAWPAVAGGLQAVSVASPAAPGEHAASELLLNSVSWSLAVAVAAMVLGWVPGRLLARALGRGGYPVLAALYVVPLCLPAYIVFYAWWQAWPADSGIYKWAQAHELVREVRLATLFVSLTAWSWPIVAWCVAVVASGTPAERDEAMQVDGAGRVTRLLDAARCDVPGLAVGALLVFLITFNNTTCFDLAEVWTFGNELRVIAARGAAPAEQIAAAGPALAVAVVGGAVTWWLLGTRRWPHASRTPRGSRSAIAATAVIWLVTMVGPIGLFGHRAAGADQLASFFRTYGGGLARTLMLAGGTALVAALVAVATAMLWQDRRGWARGLGHVTAIGWLAAALMPAHAVAAALEAAYNIPAGGGKTAEITVPTLGNTNPLSDITVADVVYRTPIILVLGHLARFGFVSVLLGRRLALQEPRTLTELRRIDGADTLAGMWRTTWPRLMAAATASFAVVAVMSAGEIAVTARLQPPGFEAIAGSVLNAVHYQRPEVVVAALLAFVLLALVSAGLIGVAWRSGRSWGRLASPVLIAAVLLLAGCLPDEGGAGGSDYELRAIFGGSGASAGRFDYPRALAVDRERGHVYVVDKTARVQRFDADGEHLGGWRMPEWELGKPTGLSVAPDGTVFVADTHYYRIVAYGLDGRERLRFGGYGEEPGRFIYPTDVAFGPDGRLYVSEYGGNDRIQVFSAAGEYLFGFGTFGEERGQFNRPQSMLFDPTRTRLYIADSCNHRIVVVDPDGKVLTSFGREGRAPGELLYPYDLSLLDDGTLLVAEFGNNRIQRLGPAGEPLGVFGRVGTAAGELKYPWGVDVSDDRVYVLDSGNNRVQIVDLP